MWEIDNLTDSTIEEIIINIIPVPLNGQMMRKKTKRLCSILDTETGLKDACGKGKRSIMLPIGSDEGFVDGGVLLFEGSKSGDYHQEMNATILKTLPNNAVIVLDNASYHSRKVEKIPTTS
jgi:hypothetical protein